VSVTAAHPPGQGSMKAFPTRLPGAPAPILPAAAGPAR
jgi:hypothetical protein